MGRGKAVWKIGLGEVEEGQREVCEGESDAFGAGSNKIYTSAAVVGKGWTKGKSANPHEGPKCRGVRDQRRQSKVGQGGE
jgi:hypothetical protein